MSGSFEKSVKGGTKIKLAAPKSKYVEHILVATHAGEAGVAEIFRALQNRLRDSTWTIVFKSLIIVHLMIREGEPQVTLKFLAESPSKLAISNFSDAQVQGSNIRHYYTYLLVRAKAYRDTRLDWIREGQGRLKRQTVDKGLLRETETVQSQISALLKCDLLTNEPENEITLTAFRYLTMDLLVLFHVMNEGTINVLEHYFEMSKFDAKRALSIYKTFSRQTNQVVEYLSTARKFENATRLEIPKLKHAPTSLTGNLEEYLNDPDFEINRRQYLAQQEAKKGPKNVTNRNGEQSSRDATKTAGNKKPESKQTFQAPPSSPPVKPTPKGPAPDLIDFFDSIEQNQQPMATQSQQQSQAFQLGAPFSQSQQAQPTQQSGFSSQPQSFPIQNGQLQQQNSNPFGTLDSNPFGQSQAQPPQQNFTGIGFGGFPQQPYHQPTDLSAGITQQNNAPDFSTFQPQQQQQQPPQQQYSFNTSQQPQSTNPFRQSVMSPNTSAISSSFTNAPLLPSSQPYQSTNPFARSLSLHGGPSNQSTPFGSPPPQVPSTASFPQPPSTPFNSPHPQPQPTTPFSQPQSTPFISPPPPSQPQSTFPQPLQPLPTGTNPFSRNTSQNHPAPAALVPTPTGSTNPFRQNAFPTQQQHMGDGWLANQGSMGGLEHLDTVPVFPRPGQGQGQGSQSGWP